MADQPIYTQADVDSLGQKLTQFKQTLTEGEVAAMVAVFQSSIPQAEDVEGYVLGNKGDPGAVLPDPSTLVNPFLSPYPLQKAKQKT